MQEKCPQRKQIRLKEYDYSKPGYYFITICTKNRKEILGKIINVGADDPVRPKTEIYKEKIKIELTAIGKIIEKCLTEINKIYENVKLDKYVIMPNHIHGIIIINGRTESSAPTKNNTRI